MSESAIMKQIKQALGYSGWVVKRVPPSIYASKGWCDLIACKKGTVLFIECKTHKPYSKASGAQMLFEADIKHAGCNYVIARSIDDIQEWIKGRLKNES